MALFQVLRGKAENLKKKKFHDGYLYFTPDDEALYIDAETDGQQKRVHINPKQISKEERTEWNSKAPGIHASQHSSAGSDPISPSDIGAIPADKRGAADGVASLDTNRKVPEDQLPTADAMDALGMLYETGILTPAQQDGTFYLAPTGEIYII